MASGYPGTLDSLPTTRGDATVSLTTHAEDHNDVNDAVNKIEAELGVNPSGADVTVAARLAALGLAFADEGTSFPGSPIAKQFFLRTDEKVLYRRNSANTGWGKAGVTELADMDERSHASLEAASILPDAHHPQMHVGNGPMHTYAGLIAGRMFKALSATSADFADYDGMVLANLAAQASKVNATGDFNLITFTLPANTLKVGQQYRIEALLSCDADATGSTFAAKAKLGGTILDQETVTITNLTDAGFYVWFEMTVRAIGASGAVIGGLWAARTGSNMASTGVPNATTTKDTTGSLALALDIAMGTAAAGNGWTCDVAKIVLVKS